MRCNILNPIFLTDQHLIAERRELRMIPPLLHKRIISKRNLTEDIPEKFTLGKGHMLFWLNKMRYLFNRYQLLTNEMISRNFKPNVDLTFDLEESISVGMDGNWIPKDDDFEIIAQRIRERINQRFSWYKYEGKPLSQEWFQDTYSWPYF